MGDRSMSAIFGKVKEIAEDQKEEKKSDKSKKSKRDKGDKVDQVIEETASTMSLKDVDDLKDRLVEKISGMKDLEEGLFWIGTLVGRAKLLWAMVKDKGFDVGAGSKLMVGAGLLYFILPADLLPDVIPGIGFLDDAMVLARIWSALQTEIERYSDYLQQNNRVMGDTEALAFADAPKGSQ